LYSFEGGTGGNHGTVGGHNDRIHVQRLAPSPDAKPLMSQSSTLGFDKKMAILFSSMPNQEKCSAVTIVRAEQGNPTQSQPCDYWWSGGICEKDWQKQGTESDTQYPLTGVMWTRILKLHMTVGHNEQEGSHIASCEQ
jgi:hypothetical protein